MSGPVLAIWIIIVIAMGIIILLLVVERRRLQEMAYKDAMTGLLNRNALNGYYLRQKAKDTIAVLFLDLDQFKEINDTLGHHVGDLIIREVGHRLQLFVNPELQVFRIGGDEFLIIAKQYDEQQAERLAEQVLYSIRNVYDIDGLDLHVSGSIGICIGSMLDDPLTLLKHADSAMYKAKYSGKNGYYVYTEMPDSYRF